MLASDEDAGDVGLGDWSFDYEPDADMSEAEEMMLRSTSGRK